VLLYPVNESNEVMPTEVGMVKGEYLHLRKAQDLAVTNGVSVKNESTHINVLRTRLSERAQSSIEGENRDPVASK
jgi:hypothetical protein